jgi:gamma-glutamyltranspeptidase
MPTPPQLPPPGDSALVEEPPKDSARSDSTSHAGHKKALPAVRAGASGALVRSARDASTHFSVVDADGNAVAVTQSLGTSFGSRLVEHLGFFYQTAPSPGETPPVVPTIVTRNGHVDLVLGSSGSERGVAAVLQVLQGAIDLQQPLEDAVLAPRVSLATVANHERGRVFLEGLVWEDPMPGPEVQPTSWSESDEWLLRQRGFSIGEQPGGPWPAQMDPWFGGVNAIARSGDGWTAIGDDRRDGVGGALVEGAQFLQRNEQPVNGRSAPERSPLRDRTKTPHRKR